MASLTSSRTRFCRYSCRASTLMPATCTRPRVGMSMSPLSLTRYVSWRAVVESSSSDVAAGLTMGILYCTTASGMVEITVMKSSSAGLISGEYSIAAISPCVACRSVKYGSTVFFDEQAVSIAAAATAIRIVLVFIQEISRIML